VFGVVVPDETKAIVYTADPLTPRLVAGFLEYAQARGFEVDPRRKAWLEPCPRAYAHRRGGLARAWQPSPRGGRRDDSIDAVS
jgi:hypothetical protein